MSDIAIKIENLKKQYRLGSIGGQTLNAELQSWWARKRGKEDPNTKIGEATPQIGEAFWALDGINLEVKKGEAIGIIGGNGAGKSTLLKILSRVTAPTEGDVWINGRMSSMLEVGTGFHAELTGRENIYMNGAILGMNRKEVDSKIESIIDFSECRQFIDTPVKRYSSGMYVKLAFAVASHLDSEIMVMDEVLAVGDMKFQKKCLGRMGDEAKGGKTVLYVSHNMATIRNLCTRCIVLQKGKLIFDGDTEEAISVYMDQAEDELVNHLDVENMARSVVIFATKIKILEFDFYGKNAPIFTTEEKMLIKLKLCAYENITDFRVRLEIRYADDSIVGMSESGAIHDFRKDEIRDIILGFETKNLAEGTYSFRLSLFLLDKTGIHYGLDDIPQKIFFKIIDTVSDRTGWLRQYWGNVRFDSLEVIK